MESRVLKVAPDQCPVTSAVNLIGARWTGLVIWQLLGGGKRYSELMQALPGISPKTLADRLQTLEEGEIVHRRVWPTKPPRVEYTLTDRGQALGEVFTAIERWALDE